MTSYIIIPHPTLCHKDKYMVINGYMDHKYVDHNIFHKWNIWIINKLFMIWMKFALLSHEDFLNLNRDIILCFSFEMTKIYYCDPQYKLLSPKIKSKNKIYFYINKNRPNKYSFNKRLLFTKMINLK